MRHVESRIQCEFVKWFRLQYPRYYFNFFSVPNGGARGRVEASIMKAEGIVAGVSDMVLLYPGRGYHGLCLEWKTTAKGSRQSDNQKSFEKAVTDAGYLYAVCRTFDEGKALLDWYLSV